MGVTQVESLPTTIGGGEGCAHSRSFSSLAFLSHRVSSRSLQVELGENRTPRTPAFTGDPSQPHIHFIPRYAFRLHSYECSWYPQSIHPTPPHVRQRGRPHAKHVVGMHKSGSCICFVYRFFLCDLPCLNKFM